MKIEKLLFKSAAMDARAQNLGLLEKSITKAILYDDAEKINDLRKNLLGILSSNLFLSEEDVCVDLFNGKLQRNTSAEQYFPESIKEEEAAKKTKIFALR